MGGRGEGGEESAFKNEFWHLAMKLHLHPLLPPPFPSRAVKQWSSGMGLPAILTSHL